MGGMAAIITFRMACIMAITRFRRMDSPIMEDIKCEGRKAPFYMGLYRNMGAAEEPWINRGVDFVRHIHKSV